MKFSPRALGRHLLGGLASATLQAWVMVLCVALTLSVLRLLQMAWHWPQGLDVSGFDLWAVAVQGARFDLKVCAAAALLLWPLLLIVPARWHGPITGTVAVLFVTASLINLHYYGFYKTPIDPVVFGFFEDDTQAILQTIWSDFPVTLTLLVLVGASVAAIAARRALYGRLSRGLNRRLAERRVPVLLTTLGVLLGLFLLVLTTKGTLRAMALGRQNVSVTTSQFLNDMVPNGIIALKYAWDSRGQSQNFTDPLAGLKSMGFDSPQAAAQVLGWPHGSEAEVLALTDEAIAQDRARHRDLVQRELADHAGRRVGNRGQPLRELDARPELDRPRQPADHDVEDADLVLVHHRGGAEEEIGQARQDLGALVGRAAHHRRLEIAQQRTDRTHTQSPHTASRVTMAQKDDQRVSVIRDSAAGLAGSGGKNPCQPGRCGLNSAQQLWFRCKPMIKSGPEGPLFFVGRSPAGAEHDADGRRPPRGRAPRPPRGAGRPPPGGRPRGRAPPP